MTNLVIITLLTLTNTMQLSLHPSNKEMICQDVVNMFHVYQVDNKWFTNKINSITNEPERFVWKKEKQQRNSLGVADLVSFPPMPSVNKQQKDK